MSMIRCPRCHHHFAASVESSRNKRATPVALMRECRAMEVRGGRVTAGDISRLVGKTQPYVSKLLFIGKNLDARVLDAWEESWEREKGARVPVAAMLEFAQLFRNETPRAQMKEFERLQHKARVTKETHARKHTVPRRRRS